MHSRRAPLAEVLLVAIGLALAAAARAQAQVRAFTALYDFCSQSGCADGGHPLAALVQGSDGNFYGTANLGGINGVGTVYKITPRGALTLLYAFCSQSGCADGAYPAAALVQGSDGDFYGTTSQGGANGLGTVFKITASGTLTTLYSFCSQSGCTDGAGLLAGLVQGSDGNFYGTTFNGGANGGGTVFQITPSGTLTTLYSFCSQSGCTDGANPYAGLVQGSDGNFYGTTYDGGANSGPNGTGFGTVFQITPSGTLTTLYSFCSQGGCADGTTPQASLLQGSDGNFYGTTEYGGGPSFLSKAYGFYGTVFSITPSGALTTLHQFGPQPGGGGYYPDAQLVQGNDGNFYGTTYEGGIWDSGTLFIVTPSGAQATLYRFCFESGCHDGAQPWGLVKDSYGNLYGTTQYGGVYEAGTVYRWVLVSPIASVSPASLTFPAQDVGATSLPQTVTLSNMGNTSLTLNSVTTSGDFAQTNTCGDSVAAGGSCTISVTFTPLATVTQTGTLTITDDSDALGGSQQIVSLKGAGVIPLANLSAGSLSFANQAIGITSMTKNVTLLNSIGTLILSSIAITGANAGDFAQTNNCTSSLASGASCTISVTFTPATLAG
jgi:uncharacterized repeat protein (TIGR03803 family)